jgi:membrane-bound serine protease (ClpP class)
MISALMMEIPLDSLDPTWGLSLIVLAVALLVLEIFIVSYGFLSVAGLLFLSTGSMLLLNTSESAWAFAGAIGITLAVVIGLFLLGIGYFVWHDRQRKKVIFNSVTGKEGIIAAVLSSNSKQRFYQVRVAGELWKATSAYDLQEGDVCRVKACHDLTLTIVPLSATV